MPSQAEAEPPAKEVAVARARKAREFEMERFIGRTPEMEGFVVALPATLCRRLLLKDKRTGAGFSSTKKLFSSAY
jgi:hypothetical protein